MNNDMDAKKTLIYHGLRTWTAGSTSHQFTQGVTKMATIESVLLTKSVYAALASASVAFKVGTISGGTVTIRLVPLSSAANSNNTALGLHFAFYGAPDRNRIVV